MSGLTDPVSGVAGVGESRARVLRSIGIESVADLLEYYPRDYVDLSELKTIASLSVGAVNVIRGFLAAEPENISFKSKRAASRPLVMTKARLRDQTGECELIWFNQPFLKKNFAASGLAQEYVFTGRVTHSFGRLQMESPAYEKFGAKELLSSGRIVPVYTLPKSLPQKTFRSIIHAALKGNGGEMWPEHVPGRVLSRHGLCGKGFAVSNIHFPESDEKFRTARRRLVFEELFFMQASLFLLKESVSEEAGEAFADLDAAPFLSSLPFALTRAQSKALGEILADLRSGSRMNRLIQGDVGSGKTALAMAACYAAAINGYQSAVMAPTEVLANQHMESFTKAFAPFGFRTALLTGSMKKSARDVSLGKIKSGGAKIIIGTHALIQQGVAFDRLALIITDEQHRFGVNQRLGLTEKGGPAVKPHALVMTATPIPRTLGLILYGDMDVSVIDELPPGRIPVETYGVDSSYRARIHNFIKKEVSSGRQAIVICPSIEDAEIDEEDGARQRRETASVIKYAGELKALLGGITVEYLHGRMKPAEKEAVMDSFKKNFTSVVVSTTVIEVGVHVENASLIVVENAERFGLSQLHQLRGRVGRGSAKSYCVLITDVKNEQTASRIKAMASTTDGFRLSELDLEQRGAGDFFGVRQHGLPAFKIANLYRDLDVLCLAQEAAQEIVSAKHLLDGAERAAFEQKSNAFCGDRPVRTVL